MDLLGIGGALLGGLMGGKDSKQSQSNVKEPYAPAKGWLDSNIADGQALQNYYKQNPFSQAQQNAYGNQSALSDSFRAVLPGLNKSMSSTQYFDRSNPLQRPTGFNFTGGDTSQASQPQSVNNGSNVLPINPWSVPPAESIGKAQQTAPSMISRGGSGLGGQDAGSTMEGPMGQFNYDPNSYTGGLLNALLGSGTQAPVTDMSTLSAATQAERDAMAGYGSFPSSSYGGYTTGSGYDNNGFGMSDAGGYDSSQGQF